MKRWIFNEFNRRIKADAKRYHRACCASVKVLTPEDLYARAYADFVDTGMVTHAFFFVYYRHLFNSYWLDIKRGIVL